MVLGFFAGAIARVLCSSSGCAQKIAHDLSGRRMDDHDRHLGGWDGSLKVKFGNSWALVSA